MNKYFRYDNYDLWQDEPWDSKASTIFRLVKWIGNNSEMNDRPYEKILDGKTGEACHDLDCFDMITKGVFDPDVLKYWEDKGLSFYGTTQGSVLWIAMAPKSAKNTDPRELKLLVVFHQEKYADPYWAMRTLEYYNDYNEQAAKDGDTVLLYVVTQGPDRNGIYPNIMQETGTLYPVNMDKVYLDVSEVYDKGKKLKDVEGFTYCNENGEPEGDPDEAVIYFWDRVPALDISRRWENKYSLTQHQTMHDRWSSEDYVAENLVHNLTGKSMMDGIVLEYKYSRWSDPGFLKYWDDMGLNYECREGEGQRWFVISPKGALEEPENKLPVLAIMQEVTHTNEHLPVTAASYYYEFYKLAAQGDMIIVTFVLEDPDSNNFLAKILREDIFENYPVDTSRVYITGQSHNGHFAYEFAARNLDLITAVATFSDSPWLTRDRVNDRMFEIIKNNDLPVISLAGMTEMGNYFPANKGGQHFRPQYVHLWNYRTFEERYELWQRRLIGSRCKPCTREEMLAAADSPDRATRMVGVPNDRSQTLYADGIEHYIVDIKNVDGKYHLRMVASENMPHNTIPFQQVLAWSFLRNFSKNMETGEITELY